MMQELSNREKLLYEAIRELGGGVLSEEVLRRKTGLGHATLWAARRDLIDKGLLVVTRENRRSVFSLTASEPESLPSTTPSSDASPSTAAPPPTSARLLRNRSARRRLRLGSPKHLLKSNRISRALPATTAIWTTGRMR